MANSEAAPRPWWKRPMSLVGGTTAVLGLFFAVQQLVGFVGDWHGRRQRVEELIDVAQQQRAAKHYAEALASLDSAARLDDNNDVVRIAGEDLAMEWLRDARVREGEQTFTELVKPLIPIIERGALRSEGSRKADLIAHAGWADFLRWRDGARELSPETHYKRALEIDANNAFAHAMWGHFIYFTGGAAPEAAGHFNAAIKSGREQKYVRDLQIVAALNYSGDDSDDVLFRIANESRLRGDSVATEYRRRIFWDICTTKVQDPDTWKVTAAPLSGAAEIATLGWLAESSSDDYQREMLGFCEARAHARAGDRARALQMLRRLELEAAGDMTRARAKAAADRLASS